MEETRHSWPSPVEVKSKDIGKGAFHKLIDLFQKDIKNKETIIRNFLKELGLDNETVPCYEKHCKWAVAFGKNAGGRDSRGSQIGYYFLKNYKDKDVKNFLKREYHLLFLKLPVVYQRFFA